MEGSTLSKNTNDYQKEVHDALEKCQFVEETLRVYINLVIDIAKLEMASHFPVRFTTTDLSKLPLGKLVGFFSKLSNNTSLISSLKNIATERNYVAHRSLLFTLGELQDPEHIAQAVLKMEDIKKRAKQVHDALLNETSRLRRSLSTLKRSRKLAIK